MDPKKRTLARVTLPAIRGRDRGSGRAPDGQEGRRPLPVHPGQRPVRGGRSGRLTRASGEPLYSLTLNSRAQEDLLAHQGTALRQFLISRGAQCRASKSHAGRGLLQHLAGADGTIAGRHAPDRDAARNALFEGPSRIFQSTIERQGIGQCRATVRRLNRRSQDILARKSDRKDDEG